MEIIVDEGGQQVNEEFHTPNQNEIPYESQDNNLNPRVENVSHPLESYDANMDNDKVPASGDDGGLAETHERVNELDSHSNPQSPNQLNEEMQPVITSDTIVPLNTEDTVVKNHSTLEMKIIQGSHLVIILTAIPAFGMAIELYLLSVEVTLGVVVMSALCFTGSLWCLYFYKEILPNMRVLMFEALCGFISLFCASAAYDTFGTIMACGYTFGDHSYFTKAAYCVKEAGKESKTCDCANIYYDCIQFTSTKCYEDCNYCLESVPIRCETVLGLVCCYLFVSFLLSTLLYCSSIWSDLTMRIKNISFTRTHTNKYTHQPANDIENINSSGVIDVVKADEESGDEIEIYAAKIVPEEVVDIEANRVSSRATPPLISEDDIIPIPKKITTTIESIEDLESLHHMEDHGRQNSYVDDDNGSVGTITIIESTKVGDSNIPTLKPQTIMESKEVDGYEQEDYGNLVSVDDLENISHAVMIDGSLDTARQNENDDDNVTINTIPNIEDLESVKISKGNNESSNLQFPAINTVIDDDNRSIGTIPNVESLEDIQRLASFKDDGDNTTIAENDDDGTINNEDDNATLAADAIPELEPELGDNELVDNESAVDGGQNDDAQYTSSHNEQGDIEKIENGHPILIAAEVDEAFDVIPDNNH